jgi:drug/metabolite transporter (DMT)-like permease
MTRVAVGQLDPLFVGLGRSMISVVLAVCMLAWRRDPFPGVRYLPRLLVIALGVIVGFPVFSAFALRQVPAAHGAVVVGLLPLFTALCSTIRAHEKPSAAFWMAAVAGTSTVIGFVLFTSGLHPTQADLLLLAAVVTCSVGYSEGGRLSRELGGLRVISWALVIACPFLAIPVVLTARLHGLHASAAPWAAFAYMGVVSMFLAFWAWYEGLAQGGVARVSQLQLLQPFMSIAAAWLLLGEHISATTLVAALLVVASVALGRRTSILHTK